jgi:hypothetical protein
MTEKYHQMKLEEARRDEEQKNAKLIRFNVANGNLSEQSEEPIRAATAVSKGKYFLPTACFFWQLHIFPQVILLIPEVIADLFILQTHLMPPFLNSVFWR